MIFNIIIVFYFIIDKYTLPENYALGVLQLMDIVNFVRTYQRTNNLLQWRIQDFPLVGDADLLRRDANLRCIHFLAKTYAKTKEIDPVGGGGGGGGGAGGAPRIRQCIAWFCETIRQPKMGLILTATFGSIRTWCAVCGIIEIGEEIFRTFMAVVIVS